MNRLYANVMKEETRLAIVDEAGDLQQIIYERPQLSNRVNHMYKGVVKNVLPGMSAAFLDIGIGQNVYLNLQEQGKQKKVHVGEVLLVQIVKDAMLGKSARVTTDVSLAGHYMVLLPNDQQIHISKKITDPELRQSLKDMAQPYLERGVGFILRTAAMGASPEEIARDMAYLHQTWEHLQKRYKVAQNGTEIYGDANLWYRVIRDYVGPTVGSIMVDDMAAYEELQQLLGAGRFGKPVDVSLWNQKEDIFKTHGIEEQIDALLNHRIDLPSGGSLQIDQTEALTVIDVNSAHYSGKNEQAGQVAKRVNQEAAHMIARQLRLRNLGGIIICDFIDMPKQDMEELVQLMHHLVKKDPIKTVVCGITSLGLLELTRKRERQSIPSILFDTCSSCGGTGHVLKGETVYLQILRRLRELYRFGRLKTDVSIVVHPDVGQFFTKQVLESLRTELQRIIQIENDTTMGLEAYSLLALGDV
ncbi:Rne/Rng family ribonuclease [Veillonella sp. VA137]|uniref:Rne/Rng family ribonuclease n=1 Tax=Veillonella sp. VA137 TaxID=741828 RepID=UPI000F8E0F8A|nr:Rne/Rng family ribonuclease [Veillonella sp. VA137]